MKKVIAMMFILMFILATALMGCGPVSESNDSGVASTSKSKGADYEGVWKRTGTYTDGHLVGTEAAVMTLTKESFDSESQACGNSGSLEVKGNQMVMIVEESNCPSIINVGSRVSYSYSVEGDKLTVVNTEYGAEVKETYVRK